MNFFRSIEGGVLWSHENFKVFFGNKWTDSFGLDSSFPKVEFKTIKQVHGNRVVLASNQLVEADGHFTSNSNYGLQIKTADCIPFFIIDSLNKNIMAIHAGWRGVASQIATQAIKELTKIGGQPSNFKVVVGPHIRRQSFEVDQPVWIQLMDSLPVDFHHESTDYFDETSSGKYKVDLEAILKAQLQSEKVKLENIVSLNIDTLSDPQWHSYRREKENAGRNISFIYREERE